MATKSIFTCNSCGSQSPKWLGRCPDCAQWNSFIEENFTSTKTHKQSNFISDAVVSKPPKRLSDIEKEEFLRTSTTIGELDRVLGGGLVEGSVVLVGGEPGIGKSTLMLQAGNIIAENKKVLYISGEESLRQMKLRAERLGLSSKELYLVNETDLINIAEHIKKLKPYLVIVDSIQTIFNSQFTQSGGSLTQVKESAGALTAIAKSSGVSVFIIGHITKEGFIAGPKVLEHIVDSVIYFEGEKNSSFRILRSIKNRFGPTDEIGIFSMTSKGLQEIKDPSGIFISNRKTPTAGTVITSTIEGTRPLLVEIQALVSRSNFSFAKQRSMGFDFNRLALLAAMLEKKLGLNLANHDIFLNIVGGVKISETAVDLAACVAIVSSFKDKPVRDDLVVIGEVGLTSEIRSVSKIRDRLNEAQRLGFKKAIIPSSDSQDIKGFSGIDLIGVDTVDKAVSQALE